MALITLITDFGTADGYVGAMKGVLHRLAPGTTVVDVAHDVPRHDVAHAAWVVATAAREFPVGTIHVVVVDPGVGGARAEVVVAADGHRYVGPDNGVFAHVTRTGLDGSWAITSTAFRLPDAAPTFHGRDVFAPAAAALARDLPPRLAGPATCLAGALPWPPPADGRGHVIHVDVFGNLITDLVAPAAATGAVRIHGRTVTIHRTFADVERGALVAYPGSSGTLEVAIREGDAATALGVRRGDEAAWEPSR